MSRQKLLEWRKSTQQNTRRRTTNSWQVVDTRVPLWPGCYSGLSKHFQKKLTILVWCCKSVLHCSSHVASNCCVKCINWFVQLLNCWYTVVLVCLMLLFPGTYLETDFDRSVTRDISVHARPEVARGTVRQIPEPAESQLVDMLRHPAHMSHDRSPYRQSQIPSAGHGGRSPEKIPELTGGRYPAYRGDTTQPTSRSSQQSRQQQQQQQQPWYRQASGQPMTDAHSWNVPRRSGSDENVLHQHAVNTALSILFFSVDKIHQ